MTLFYQIDCSVESSGKRVALTKRQARWRWGIANGDALEAGATGASCRGREHEIILIWSVTSGKRLILLDGKEVHFSVSRRESKFQHNWTASALNKSYIFTIIAYATAPLKVTPGFKQFDLIINGQSYSKMYHIYELGLKKKPTRNCELSYDVTLDVTSHPLAREDKWKWAQQDFQFEQDRNMNDNRQMSLTRRNSTPSARNSLSSPSAVASSVDLLSASSAITNAGDLFSVSLPAQVNTNQTPSNDEFDPNRPPSRETIWSNIMKTYDLGNPEKVDPSSKDQVVDIEPWRNDDSLVVSKTKQTHAHLSQVDDMRNERNDGFLHIQTDNIDINKEDMQINKKNEASSPRDVSGIDKAMQSLVNLDDIFSPASSTTLTMYSDNEKENRGNRSVNTWGHSSKSDSQGSFGRQLTLFELKHRKANQDITPSKKIMEPHSHNSLEQSSVSMVVYHHPQQYNNYSYSYPYTL